MTLVPLTAEIACALIAARGCEAFTTGLGSCFKNGREATARYGADQACAPCVAWEATKAGRRS